MAREAHARRTSTAPTRARTRIALTRIAFGHIAYAGVVLCTSLCASACSDSNKAGCAKDTDCKGERVCVQGTCQEAPPAAKNSGGRQTWSAGTPPPPALPPSPPPPAAPPAPAADDPCNTNDEYADSMLPCALPDGTTGRCKQKRCTPASALGPYKDACNTDDSYGDSELPCMLRDARTGWCKKKRCIDLCPPGMSYASLDAGCHLPCSKKCREQCMEGVCMDSASRGEPNPPP